MTIHVMQGLTRVAKETIVVLHAPSRTDRMGVGLLAQSGWGGILSSGFPHSELLAAYCAIPVLAKD
jgi:hypothetical protein